MKQLSGIFLMLAILVAGISGGNGATATSGDDGRTDVWLMPAENLCDDVVAIFARGSGNKLHDIHETVWRRGVDRMLSQSNLSYSFYELGTKAQSGYHYPAVAVSQSTQGVLTAIGAKVSGGDAYRYGESVRNGTIELKNFLEKISKICPKTKFVVGGYSQGAQVLSKTFSEYENPSIVYIATFGDPKLYLPEGAGIIPKACLGAARSEYRVSVEDCRAHKGILGGLEPYQNNYYTGKMGTWCYRGDIMCSSRASLKDHLAYAVEKIYDEATVRIQAALFRYFPNAWQKSAQRMHDVAILLDATGSMGSFWKQHRKNVEILAKAVYDRGGRVALYDYGDLADDRQATLRCGFECSQEELLEQIENFEIEVGSGGDVKESALSASRTVMTNLNWRSGATKSLVLITDAQYLDPDRDGTTIADVVKLSKEIDPVNFFVITYGAAGYQELAEQTNGQAYGAEQFSQLMERVLERSQITLQNSEYIGMAGDEFVFIASNVEAIEYQWDLDGDGEYELTTKEPITRKEYTMGFRGLISVLAKDTFGWQSEATAKVTVYADDEVIAKTATIKSAELTQIDKTSGSDFGGSSDSNLNGNFSSNSGAEEKITAKLTFVGENIARTVVAVDDLILGYVEGSSGEILLEDLREDSRVVLAPFNADEQRGETVQLGLEEKYSAETPYIDIKTPQTGDISATAPTSISSVKTTNWDEVYILANSSLPFVKAPNAGVVTNANLDASGRRIRIYKQRDEEHDNHVRQLKQPLQLHRESRKKFFADRQPNISLG